MTTLYEWAGGDDAFLRNQTFYEVIARGDVAIALEEESGDA